MVPSQKMKRVRSSSATTSPYIIATNAMRTAAKRPIRTSSASKYRAQ